jgi:hypothetical protein
MDVILLLQPIERTFGHDGVGDYFIENGKPRRRRPEEETAPALQESIKKFRIKI